MRGLGRRGTPTHGLGSTPEYFAWRNMILRCEDASGPAYRWYGGRGISVCAAWRADFLTFLAYIGPRPGRGYSVDRFPNTNGNYEPGNVRWATADEQNRNTRRNRRLTALGETMVVSDWAKRLGIKKSALFYRLNKGWTTEAALFTPIDPTASGRAAGERRRAAAAARREARQQIAAPEESIRAAASEVRT